MPFSQKEIDDCIKELREKINPMRVQRGKKPLSEEELFECYYLMREERSKSDQEEVVDND